MPRPQPGEVHLVAEEPLLVLVWFLVGDGAPEVVDYQMPPIGQHPVALHGNIEVVLWVAEIEAEAVDQEIDCPVLKHSQGVGGPGV